MKRLLGDISTTIDYGVTASAVESPVGPKFLRITDIQDGAVDWNKVPWCNCTEREAKSCQLEDGDIVFARTGATTGKSFLIRQAPSQSVFASYLIRVRLGKEANPVYVSHFFNSPDYWRQITGRARGVAQPGVNSTSLKTLEIPLPPLAEQKRIARILDAADALRAKRREALAQLDTLLQATFLDLFGDPVTNPKGWDVRTGKEVFGDLTYGTSAKCSDAQAGEMLPVLRIPNIIGGQINREDLKFAKLSEKEVDNLRLKRDDLLFVRTNGNPDYIGRCARFDGRFESIYASYLIRARLNEESGLNAEFLKHQIESSAFRREVRKEARTTAGNYNLSTVGIKKFRFIVPPVKLQQQYTAAVEAAESQKNRSAAHLAELDTLFASLQSRAFRGEL